MQNDSAASANIKNNSFEGNQKLKAIKNLIFIKLQEKNFIKKFQIEIVVEKYLVFWSRKELQLHLIFPHGPHVVAQK